MCRGSWNSGDRPAEKDGKLKKGDCAISVLKLCKYAFRKWVSKMSTNLQINGVDVEGARHDQVLVAMLTAGLEHFVPLVVERESCC